MIGMNRKEGNMSTFSRCSNCASCKYWTGNRTIVSEKVVTVRSALDKGICRKTGKETKAEEAHSYCGFERATK